ncbi:MAG: DUF481 domain-containing protein [Acidobacteriaceae bacterium]
MFHLQQQRSLWRRGPLPASLFLLALAISPALAPSAAAQKAAAQSAPTPTDTLTFTNGETLTGELELANSDGVTFKSPVAGELTVKWDKIKELKSDNQFAVLAKNQKLKRKTAAGVVPQGTLSVADSNVQVSTSSGAKTVPVGQTDAIVNAADFTKQISGPSGFLNGWNGLATLGISLVRSTQNQTTFTGALNLVRAIPTVDWLPARNRTLIDYNQAYGSTSQAVAGLQPAQTVKTNIFHFDFERDEYITDRVYYFGGVSFDHNFSQGLDLQQQYGGGIGWTAIKSAVQELDVKADIHYQKQHFSDSTANPDQNLIGSTFGETYTRVLPRKIALDQFAAFTESWNNTNAYSSHVGANVTFPVYKGLGFNVGAIDDYLNTAPVGFNKNSFQFTTGISYTIARK